MLHEFFIMGWIIIQVGYIIFIALARVTLIGVGCWGGSFSHKYLMWPARLESCPGIFSFTRCLVRNLKYLFLWLCRCVNFGQLEGQCALCAHAILLIHLQSFVSEFFRGRSEFVWVNWWRFLRDLVWRFYNNLTGSLFSCGHFLVTPAALLLRRFCRLVIVPFFHSERSSKVFRGTDLRLQEISHK